MYDKNNESMWKICHVDYTRNISCEKSEMITWTWRE